MGQLMALIWCSWVEGFERERTEKTREERIKK
jgi:hypothetical protein